jgi:O-antigen ligase
VHAIRAITTRNGLSSRGDAFRAVGFTLTLLLVEIVLARYAAKPELSKVVLLFFGLFVVAGVFRFPLASALVLLGLTDFIFGPSDFTRQVGPVSVRPHEVFLALLFILALVRPERRTWGGKTGAALAVFLALVLVSALIGIKTGRMSLTEGFNWGRPLALLTIFYIVIRLFPEPRHWRMLLYGAAVLAAATGVIALLVSLGANFAHNLQQPGEQVVRNEGGVGSLNRVRLPGLSAGYALFWFVAVQIMVRNGRPRLFWSAILLCIGIDILVSFNRNMWIGLVVGLILMLVIGGNFVRHRITVSIGFAVAAVIALIVFSGGAGQDKVVAPVLKRGSTLLNPSKTAGENSLQDRAKETEAAWSTIQRYPILGVGAGAPFGAVEHFPLTSGSIYLGVGSSPQLFLHNQYLYLVLISGVPGLIAFLAFLLQPVAMALRRAPKDLGISACAVGVMLIMLSAFVALYFTAEDMVTMLALLTGVIVADHTSRAAEGRASGLLPG